METENIYIKGFDFVNLSECEYTQEYCQVIMGNIKSIVGKFKLEVFRCMCDGTLI